MSIKIANLTFDPPVFLAPMAGITDLPFRNLVQSFGAGLVVSEMVASQEMVQSKPGMRERAELGAGLENSAVQLAGKEARWMAEAARIVQGQGARIIDINMGCPARKVTNGYSGSALMRDPDHALRLIEAVVAAVDVPVTLKMRLGWDELSMNATELAVRAEAAGIQMVTIHGRTRCQFYKGAADWNAISRVKSAVGIPVIANGDIVNAEAARTALQQSGADGVMVGRGVQGRPWLLAEIAAELFGYPQPDLPVGENFAQMVCGHYQDAIAFYGPVLGNRVMRKHLGWYLDHVTAPAGLRRPIMTETDPDRVLGLLQDALCRLNWLAA